MEEGQCVYMHHTKNTSTVEAELADSLGLFSFTL
jgi:hypothetical protein